MHTKLAETRSTFPDTYFYRQTYDMMCCVVHAWCLAFQVTRREPHDARTKSSVAPRIHSISPCCRCHPSPARYVALLEV